MTGNITDKLRLIEYQFDKKKELEDVKFQFFKKKNDMINSNIDKIWKLKNTYQDKKHKQQLEKIRLAKGITK